MPKPQNDRRYLRKPDLAAQERRTNQESELWVALQGKYSPRIQRIIGDLGRAPTYAELAMMELAEHMAAQDAAEKFDAMAERETGSAVKRLMYGDARQIRKAMAKSRENMRHLRSMMGGGETASDRAVSVPQGLGLSVVPVVIDVDEDLVE